MGFYSQIKTHNNRNTNIDNLNEYIINIVPSILLRFVIISKIVPCAFHHVFSTVMFPIDVWSSFVFAKSTHSEHEHRVVLSNVSHFSWPSCINNFVRGGTGTPSTATACVFIKHYRLCIGRHVALRDYILTEHWNCCYFGMNQCLVIVFVMNHSIICNYRQTL